MLQQLSIHLPQQKVTPIIVLNSTVFTKPLSIPLGVELPLLIGLIPIQKDGQYSDDQPESFRKFFINEELKILGL